MAENTTRHDAFGVKFTEAIDVLKQKTPELTAHSHERVNVWHAKSFTVAGMTQASAVADIHAMVVAAKESGQSLGALKQQFAEQLAAKGWTFNGREPARDYVGYRAELIYNNNMRSAAMAGRWQQLQRNRDNQPYLRYIHTPQNHPRLQHLAWDGMVRHMDDAFWNTHYPPNGYNCKCTVMALSKADVTDEGLEVEQAPFKTAYRDVIHRKTGEITDHVPIGIDPGWDGNVGKAWIAPEVALGQKIAALPKQLQGVVVDNTLTPAFKRALNERFVAFNDDLNNRAYGRGDAQIVGFFDARTLLALEGVPSDQGLKLTKHCHHCGG